MYQLEIHLIVWFVCGAISVTIGHRPDIEHLQQWANGTGQTDAITGIQALSRLRDRQHQQQQQQQPSQPQPQQQSQYSQQSQYQYGLTKPANKQQVYRGRSNGLNELRKNLTAQKLWERQGDDPDQNNGNISPIHQIHQKIQQSDVSTPQCALIYAIEHILKFIHFNA